MMMEENCLPRSRRICPFRIYRIIAIIVTIVILAYPMGVGLEQPLTIVVFAIFAILVYVGSNVISRIIDILTEDRPPLLAGVSAAFLIFAIWALYATLIGKILIVLTVIGVIFVISYQLFGDSEKE